jgi:hypothetical protein
MIPEMQDLAMEEFRKQFKLVAGCKVSDDGKVMVYQMQTLAGAARWLSDAKQIITANLMPLEPGVKAYVKKGQEVPESVELRIVYNPKQ